MKISVVEAATATTISMKERDVSILQMAPVLIGASGG
jgi:hypothetical protein